MANQDSPEDWPVFCDRCRRPLERGRGEFYMVRIEAVADPAPPEFTERDFESDPGTEIARLLGLLDGLSGQEALDQIYRRLTLTLCKPCCDQWIENPTG